MRFHVMAETVGCLSDENCSFPDKDAAAAYALEELASYRDAGYTIDGDIAQDGIAYVAPINYLEITPCDDRSCDICQESYADEQG